MVTDDEDYDDADFDEDGSGGGEGGGLEESTAGEDGDAGEITEAERQAIRREYYDKFEIDLLRVDTSCALPQFRAEPPHVANALIE